MANEIAFDLEITKGRFRLLTFQQAKDLKNRLDIAIEEYEKDIETQRRLDKFEKSDEQFPEELFLPNQES